MDPKRFDDLTRALASGVSRRQVLKLLVATAVGGLLGLDRSGNASACAPDNGTCTSNADCCTGCCYCLKDFPTGSCFHCLNSGTKCDGAPCTTNSECCNGFCDSTGHCVEPCGGGGGGGCTSDSQCPSGQSCCSGTCINTQTDPKNCGACGNVCPSGQSCVNGKCTGSMTVRFVTSPPSEVQPTVYLRTGYNLRARVNVVPLRLTVVVEQNGQPTTQPVTVHVDDSSQNGGSGHGPGGHPGVRPHGWLLQTTDPQPTPTKIVAKNAIGGSQDTTGLDVQTSVDQANAGQATFVWLPPEIAGTDTIKVSIVGHPDVAPAVANIDVREDGFVDMPADPQHYTLIGATPEHPSNHWATPATVSDLQAAAQGYILNQQNDSQLQHILTQLTNAGYGFPAGTFPAGTPDLMQINDISLPWGGLFDVNGDWTTPHGGHRWGDMADFRTNYLVGNPQDPHHTALGDPNALPPISNLVRRAHLLMFLSLENALVAAGGQILFEANHLHVVFR